MPPTPPYKSMVDAIRRRRQEKLGVAHYAEGGEVAASADNQEAALEEDYKDEDLEHEPSEESQEEKRRMRLKAIFSSLRGQR